MKAENQRIEDRREKIERSRLASILYPLSSILYLLSSLALHAATNISVIQFSNAPSITDTDRFYMVRFVSGTNWTNFFITGGQLGTNFATPRILWVATNGNDATALPGRQDRPWASPYNAALAATNGDVIQLLPGIFSVGTNHLRLPHGASLRGSARAGSFIYGAGDRSTNGAIVNPGSDSVVADLTIVGTNDVLEQAAFGVQPNSFNAQSFTNCHLSNVRLDADFQGIYIKTNAACSMTMTGCRIDAKNAAIDTDDSGVKGISISSTIIYVDQKGAVNETIVTFDGAACISIGPNTTLDLFGCDLTVTNAVDGSIYSGIDATSAANFYGCAWRAANTNSSSFIADGALGTVRYYGGQLREGGNSPIMGTAKLTSGAATVLTTAVLTNSRILVVPVCSANAAAGLAVSNIVSATSFRVHSTSATDANRFDWILFNPAP